ncbi:uncharacterized protein LDX57_001645 [Aspergillus melleus]|uniref:uncharacterized protein n=1 Tax=Aspergillus melleus TaxID=138277 RepID=UPI001E8E99FA|nr:uncharacterized protein LDX57_001645 [Aspergillus melleus]KAH8423893.1 hypothetical protein LDX57_001645 [Aspergillus melleus]
MASVPLAGQALMPDHQQMVKVILGACLFVFRGDMQCPCASGSLVIQAHSFSAGGTCDDCGHLLSRHRDYGAIPQGHGVKELELIVNSPVSVEISVAFAPGYLAASRHGQKACRIARQKASGTCQRTPGVWQDNACASS